MIRLLLLLRLWLVDETGRLEVTPVVDEGGWLLLLHWLLLNRLLLNLLLLLQLVVPRGGLTLLLLQLLLLQLQLLLLLQERRIQCRLLLWLVVLLSCV